MYAAEILKWQGCLREVEFIDRELVGHPQGDARERDGERANLDSLDVLQGEERAERALFDLPVAAAVAQLPLAFPESLLESTEGTVGEVEEIAGSASRIEHHVVQEVLLEAPDLLKAAGVLNPFLPGWTIVGPMTFWMSAAAV